MTEASDGADELFVTGPHLVHEVHPRMASAFGTLWTAVTRAGGTNGFLPDASEEEIRAAAEEAIEAVKARREHLIILGADHELVGTVFLRPGGGTTAHRAEVLRLMVRPDLQGKGWGRVLLDAAAAHARALGLELLLLSVRGGTWLPEFYRRLGWTEVGVFPAAVRLGPEDVRDEHWFQLRLG